MLPNSSVEKNENDVIVKTINISEFKNDSMKSESTSQIKSNPQSILIDEYEKNPTQEFESLGYTIANIIKNTQNYQGKVLRKNEDFEDNQKSSKEYEDLKRSG